MKTKLIVLSLLMVGSFAITAQANTTDGETPAIETVCDSFEGTTAGLFGLCNAYCEAMDCGHEEVRAASTACSRVNDNFEKKAGFRLPELEGRFDANGNSIDSCVRRGGGGN